MLSHCYLDQFLSLIMLSIICFRPFEGIPPGTSPARVLRLLVPDARGRDGRISARRSRWQRQANILDSGLSSEGQQGKPLQLYSSCQIQAEKFRMDLGRSIVS